jgi:hypothetical protein
MIDSDIKRISWLNVILIQLQGKSGTTFKQLDEKFGIITRKIYRNIQRSLDESLKMQKKIL